MQSRTPETDEDDDEAWLRRYTLSEEYIIAKYPKHRGSLYRWFESPKVIDLLRIRRQRAKRQRQILDPNQSSDR